MSVETYLRSHKRAELLDNMWPAGFDQASQASQYVPPPTKEIFDYDSPNDPKLSALIPSGVNTGRAVFPHFAPPYVAERESVRDPFYQFSRDPDMSLDTAPYPSGIGRAGRPGNDNRGHDGATLASLRLGETDSFLKSAVKAKDPLLKFTPEGALRRREVEEIEVQGDAIVHTGWYAAEKTEENLISLRMKDLTAGRDIVGQATAEEEVSTDREGRTSTQGWLKLMQEKLSEANRAAAEAERRAGYANKLALQADQLADAAAQRRVLAEEAQQRANTLPDTIKGNVEKLRRELGEVRSEAADKERAAESARRELEYTEALAERKQRFAHMMAKDAMERRAEVEELQRQLAKLEVAKRDADSAEERAKEVQEESERFLAELAEHEKKARVKAIALAEHKRHLAKLAEQLAASIAEEELSGPQVRLAEEEALIYLEMASSEEAQAKDLVLQWGKVKEEVKALEELEQEARKEALKAQPEGAEVEVGAFYIREPKQAQGMIENGGKVEGVAPKATSLLGRLLPGTS